MVDTHVCHILCDYEQLEMHILIDKAFWSWDFDNFWLKFYTSTLQRHDALYWVYIGLDPFQDIALGTWKCYFWCVCLNKTLLDSWINIYVHNKTKNQFVVRILKQSSLY